MVHTSFLAALLAGQALAGSVLDLSTRAPRACESITRPEIPGAQITDFVAQTRRNISGLGLDEAGGAIEIILGLDVCNVNVTLTHPGVGDVVTFEIWLPLENWNNRFLGTGGGGWRGGEFEVNGLGFYVQEGYVAGATDGGNMSDGDGYLLDSLVTSPGHFDLGRFSDFGVRAFHEMSIIGKHVATEFFGQAPKYSYWTGCSQGGRQGFDLAQNYPDDYDGIVANSPALYLPGLLVAMSWAQVSTRRIGHVPSSCVLDEFTKASTAFCDGLDGVIDNVIANPAACKFDAYSLVGTTVTCSGSNQTVIITDEDAEVVFVIHDGPRSSAGTLLWDGYPWGISYESVLPADSTQGARLWNDWIRLMLAKNTSYDIESYNTVEQVVDFFATSTGEWDGIIGTGNPDLAAFRDRGGKLISWHGTADPIIMINNSVRYREQVEAVLGGNQNVNEFYRFFESPGVSHCAGGNGAFPVDSFTSLLQWVEQGQAPEVLHGTTTVNGVNASRIICPWPLVARFGGGDPNNAGAIQLKKENTNRIKRIKRDK